MGFLQRFRFLKLNLKSLQKPAYFALKLDNQRRSAYAKELYSFVLFGQLTIALSRTCVILCVSKAQPQRCGVAKLEGLIRDSQLPK